MLLLGEKKGIQFVQTFASTILAENICEDLANFAVVLETCKL